MMARMDLPNQAEDALILSTVREFPTVSTLPVSRFPGGNERHFPVIVIVDLHGNGRTRRCDVRARQQSVGVRRRTKLAARCAAHR